MENYSSMPSPLPTGTLVIQHEVGEKFMQQCQISISMDNIFFNLARIINYKRRDSTSKSTMVVKCQEENLLVITYNQLVHHSMQTTQACLHKNALSMVGKISQLHES